MWVRYATLPKSNAEFWHTKISSNIKRDYNNYSKLEMDGWRVLIVWSCELRKKRDIILRNLVAAVNNYD